MGTCIANRPELVKSRVLELNASDERGITVVRDKIKHFARLAVSTTGPCVVANQWPNCASIQDRRARRGGQHDSRCTGRTAPHHGTIQPDHALLSDLQLCHTVRKMLTSIIEPLASRCSKFRFKPLDTASAEARLAFIAQAEKVPVNPAMLKALVDASDGDLRRAITYLQSAALLVGARQEPLSAAAVGELAGVVPTEVIERIARSVGIDSTGGSFDGILAAVQGVVLEGYSCMQVVLQLHDLVVEHPLLPAGKKTRCALRFGETDKALIDGGNEELQLLNLCLGLCESCR